MQHQGYWLTEYLTISKILRQGPAKYTRAFMLTETDDLDVTYFILFKLHLIKRAIEDLHKYLTRKINEVRKVEQALRGADHFNHRKLALLSNAIRTPGQNYTFRSTRQHSQRH